MANLKAEVHGVEAGLGRGRRAPGRAVDAVRVQAFEPKAGVKIETDPKATEAASAGQDDEAIIEDTAR